jgi:phage-related protein
VSNALYQAYVEVVPESKNLRKTLAKDFDAAGADAGSRAGKGVNSGILGSIGKLAGPLAAAFASIGIAKIIKDSIGNASDLAEAGTAITAVFGDADKTIQKFAAGSAASLGQSTNQTLDAARVFGVFGKAAGLSGDDLAGFSTDFITLAADLASFNNTTPEAAISALGAGLRGESEPLRQFGILLDDATLKARATELGIYSGTGALTQQQKVLASQAEIMAQTGIQQGDFAKTSGGLANQQRILSAGLENLSTTFGAIFLPIATVVVGFLNRSVVPAFQGLADMLTGGETPAAVSGFMGFFQPLIDFFQSSIAPAFATLAPVFKDLLPQLLEVWQAFSPLSLILESIGPLLPQLVDTFVELAVTLGGALGSALTTLMPAFAELSGILVQLFTGVLADLLPVVMDLVTTLGPVLGDVLTTLAPLFAELVGAIGDVLVAVIPLLEPILGLVEPLGELVAALLPPLVELFAALLEPILDLLPVLIDILVPILKVIVEVLAAVVTWVAEVLTWFIQLVTGSGDAGDQLASIWNDTMGMFADFFANTGGMFADFFSNSAGMVADFVGNTFGMFADFWSNTVGMFSDGIGNIVGFFTGLPGKVWDAVKGLAGMLTDLGKNMIQGLIDGAGSLLKNLGKFFLDIVPDFIREPFKAALGINSPSKVFAGFGENITDGLVLGVGRGQGAVDSAMGSMVSVPSLSPRLDSSVYGVAARGNTSSSDLTLNYVNNGSPGISSEEQLFVAGRRLKARLV